MYLASLVIRPTRPPAFQPCRSMPSSETPNLPDYELSRLVRRDPSFCTPSSAWRSGHQRMVLQPSPLNIDRLPPAASPPLPQVLVIPVPQPRVRYHFSTALLEANRGHRKTDEARVRHIPKGHVVEARGPAVSFAGPGAPMPGSSWSTWMGPRPRCDGMYYQVMRTNPSYKAGKFWGFWSGQD